MRSWPQADSTLVSGAISSIALRWVRALVRLPIVSAPQLAAFVSLTAGLIIVLSAVWPGLDFPLGYIDEGYDLALAKRLAETGQYATHVVGVPLRWFDPAVTTGPTMLAPVALAIKLFGVGVPQVRAVALAFLVLFLFASYLAARGLAARDGWLAGAVALVLLALLSHDLYDRGLRVVGEVPALGLFLLGVAAATRTTWRGWLVGGVCLALSQLAKPQMVIAVAAGVLVVVAMSWHERRRLAAHVVPFVAGVVMPYLAWHLYQIGVVGWDEWRQINSGFYDLFATSSGASRIFTWDVLLPLLLTGLAASLVLAAVVWRLRREPAARSTALQVLGRIAVLTLVLLPLPLLRWNLVGERFAVHWRGHPAETCVALLGLTLALVIGLSDGRVPLVLTAASGILLAEWYFGINEVGWQQHSLYWRLIGLVLAGVVVAHVVTIASGKASRVLGRLLRSQPLRDGKPLFTSALAILTIALIARHSLDVVRAEPARANEGMADAARWIQENTPDDAILLGSGWWLPWEAAYVSNRDVADVEASAFRRADFTRPAYLVMPPDWLGAKPLAPEVEAVMRNPELLLFEAAGSQMTRTTRSGAEDFTALGANVYYWPAAPPEVAALGREKRVELDVLAALAEGKVELTPSPRSGILDEAHGHFIYPWHQGLRQGLRVIAPVTMTTGPVPIRPNDAFLIGYWAPRSGAGVTLTLSALAPVGTAVPIWSDYIPSIAPSPETYQTRLVSLPALTKSEVRLRLEVSPAARGNGEEDRFFLGHLAIVRVPSDLGDESRSSSVASPEAQP
jgi:hypothetical protein